MVNGRLKHFNLYIVAAFFFIELILAILVIPRKSSFYIRYITSIKDIGTFQKLNRYFIFLFYLSNIRNTRNTCKVIYGTSYAPN